MGLGRKWPGSASSGVGRLSSSKLASLKVSILFPSSSPKCGPTLKKAISSLEPFQTELEVFWPRDIQARKEGDSSDYLAGSDLDRSSELAEFLLAEERQVAWFGRGGYGVTRLLRELSSSLEGAFVPVGKRWMGYSDITALFAFVKATKTPIECIHGPMLCAFPEQPNKSDLLEALRGVAVAIPLQARVVDLRFEGPIWGGNLAVLASLCGTPWLPQIESDQAIFLEDIDEAPYRVDRYITQLFDSGFFKKSKRIILGTFTGYEPKEVVVQTAFSRCQELGLQVLGQIPVGHSEPHSPLFLDKPYRYCGESRQLLPQF